MEQRNIWTEYASTELHNGTEGHMGYVRSSRSERISKISPFHRKGRSALMPTRSLRSTQPCSLHTQSRAPLTPSRLFSYYVKTHPCQSSSQQSRRRLLCLYSFIDVSSFILFFSSVFSSFTVCISSSISVSLVLKSSTNFCRFCSISNVVLLVLIAAAAASVDAVGTPMVMGII